MWKIVEIRVLWVLIGICCITETNCLLHSQINSTDQLNVTYQSNTTETTTVSSTTVANLHLNKTITEISTESLFPSTTESLTTTENESSTVTPVLSTFPDSVHSSFASLENTSTTPPPFPENSSSVPPITTAVSNEIDNSTSTPHPIAQPKCKCGVAEFGKGKIVGGTEVDRDRVWPWFALIVRGSIPSLKSHCGGSLISNRYVVTAAHCLMPMVQYGLKNFRILLGYHNLNLTKGANTADDKYEIPIEFVTLYPKYEQSNPYHYDIGLIKLAYPVKCESKRVRPICLPKSEEDSQDEDESRPVITVGFGKTSTDTNTNASSVLRQIQINTISNKDCKMHYSKLPFEGPTILDSMICAWAPGRDSCVGDSGGPLFAKMSSPHYSYVQIGVTSWGIGCANERYPGVYSRLSKFLPWIKSVVMDL